jgi:hypothetical protein
MPLKLLGYNELNARILEREAYHCHPLNGFGQAMICSFVGKAPLAALLRLNRWD